VIANRREASAAFDVKAQPVFRRRRQKTLSVLVAIRFLYEGRAPLL